jgi:hypothetical protein
MLRIFMFFFVEVKQTSFNQAGNTAINRCYSRGEIGYGGAFPNQDLDPTYFAKEATL